MKNLSRGRRGFTIVELLVGKKPFQIAAAGAARTFQNIRLFGELSVVDNVRVACHLRSTRGMWAAVLRTGGYRREEHDIAERAEKLLELFGLSEHATSEARSLPYGDQRRLEIARALATQPKLLLLDEPAAGMNPQEKIELQQLNDWLRREFGIAVLLIEHDMGLVMGVSDRILVMEHGRPIVTGTPQEVRNDPRVIKAYLGED